MTQALMATSILTWHREESIGVTNTVAAAGAVIPDSELHAQYCMKLKQLHEM